jgi:hypothetical protein
MAEMSDRFSNDFDRFDPSDQRAQILILAERVSNLGKEKEGLERALEREQKTREGVEKDFRERLEKMEKSFQRGAGIMMVVPIIGSAIGLLLAYSKMILKPWTGAQ